MTDRPDDLIGFADFKIPIMKIPKLKSLRDPFNEPIYYRIMDGTTDTAIVLVHGMGGDSRYLTQLALQLSQATQHTILLPDLKSHGEMNQDRAVKLLPHQDVITELQFLLDNWKQNHLMIKNIVLVGHSLGGAVVLKWLMSQPIGTFQKIGLIAPYLPEPYNVESSRFGFWVKRTDEKLLLRFPEQAKWGSEVEEYDASYIKSCVLENLDWQQCHERCPDLNLFVSDADLILDVKKYQNHFASKSEINFRVFNGFSHIGLVTSPKSGQQIASELFPKN
tara:strand:- start:53137 stop:53970 length:834 start_codon:yes stop_codon:yes gene_type:complete